MKNKKGIILGVANDHSIAWGIAQKLAEQGADLAFTYQGENLEKRVRDLAEKVQSNFVIPCNITNPTDMDNLFFELEKKFGKIDFLVHAIAYSNRNELQGRYCDTTLENFLNTMQISCFSFTDLCKRASKLSNENASYITLSYLGAERVVPNYNVMGIAKAALEASIMYLAKDFGSLGIRVNGISSGPIKTLAASGIDDFRTILKWNKSNSLLRRNMSISDIGNSALYLLSDLSSGVTGEVLHVDGGYNKQGMINFSEISEISSFFKDFI